MLRRWFFFVAAIGVAAAPAAARDGLGVFGDWGGFRDAGVPRCYAIAMAERVPGKRVQYQPYATIGHWPKRALRNQVHLRLSRQVANGDRIKLTIEGQEFALVGGGGDAWADTAGTNAAIVAAMRSATRMTVTARGADGKIIRDTYRLAGAATAIDAALAGCAGLR
jgi:hypothetical protein